MDSNDPQILITPPLSGQIGLHISVNMKPITCHPILAVSAGSSGWGEYDRGWGLGRCVGRRRRCLVEHSEGLISNASLQEKMIVCLNEPGLSPFLLARSLIASPAGHKELAGAMSTR